MTKMELKQVVRFSMTGVTVAAVYVIGFVVLERLGLRNVSANLLALMIAVTLQYVVQTTWTFEKSLRDGGQLGRFAIAIGTGLVVSTVLTSVVAPSLEWSPWLAASVVAVTLPVINYLFFRFWVFAAQDAGEKT